MSGRKIVCTILRKIADRNLDIQMDVRHIFLSVNSLILIELRLKLALECEQ